jgi:hypothetical protein
MRRHRAIPNPEMVTMRRLPYQAVRRMRMLARAMI